MSKVVFLVGNYYPNYSAVGRCQGNLAEEFVKKGHDVVVIAEKSYSYYGWQEQHCGQLIKRIQYGSLDSRRLFNFIRRVMRYCKCFFAKSSLRKNLVELYYNKLLELENVDVVIPTCSPFETVCAAILYKRTHLCVKVLPVLYDMFAYNLSLYRTEWNKKLKFERNKKIEDKILRLCDKVFCVPSWIEYLRSIDSSLVDNMVTIEHPLMAYPDKVPLYWFDKNVINIVYAGYLNRKIRDPKPVLQLFGTIVNDIVKLHFFSLGEESSLANASRKNRGIVLHGYVSTMEAHSAINSADILLSIGNMVDYQVPSKIFEYMSTGLPILHFYYDDHDMVIVCPRIRNNFWRITKMCRRI